MSDRPSSAPVSWMTAITDRVNALWNTMYERQRPVAPALNVLEVELPTVPKGPVYDREQTLPFDRQETHIATVHSDPISVKGSRRKVCMETRL